MEIVYKVKGFKLTPEIKDYTQKKLKRLEKYFKGIERAEVKFQIENNPRIKDGTTVEALLMAKGSLIKATASSSVVFAAIDLLYEKLEKQLEKHRTKVYSSLSRVNSKPSEGKSKPTTVIKKRKQFIIEPMTEEEAVRRMENLNHDFFIFAKEGTSNICVIYRRKDGAYGLIEAILE